MCLCLNRPVFINQMEMFEAVPSYGSQKNNKARGLKVHPFVNYIFLRINTVGQCRHSRTTLFRKTRRDESTIQ